MRIRLEVTGKKRVFQHNGKKPGGMTMKTKIYTTMIAAVLLTSTLALASEGWLTDFEAAKKEAKERNVPILADFSGSDWCGWCIKLDSEVFSTKEFKKYAKDNVVLLLVDFPSKKKQAEEVKKQNKDLSTTYGVRGFPTVLLLDATGKEVARTGYQCGGPAKYVAHLKKLLKK
jgi:thioredoxin-related protein